MAEFLQWEVWEVRRSGREQRVAAFADLDEAERHLRYINKRCPNPDCWGDIKQAKKHKPRTPKPPRQIYGNGR